MWRKIVRVAGRRLAAAAGGQRCAARSRPSFRGNGRLRRAGWAFHGRGVSRRDVTSACVAAALGLAVRRYAAANQAWRKSAFAAAHVV